MLGMSTPTPSEAPTDLIKDGSEASFMEDVIAPSDETPIIVDFWAPWCGPCKTLGPALEAAVAAAKGAVKMVKINVDENQALAGQLRIQSIPTVYAFHKGQPVDGFQGNIAASDIKRFVEKLAALGPAPDNGLADAIEAAEAMLAEGAIDDAVETFTAILDEEPENVFAYAGLIRAHLALGNLDLAETLITTAPDAMARFTSFSLTPPTPAYTTWTFTSSVLSFSSDAASASCEPCMSALMIMGRCLTSPASMLANMFSSLAACCLASLVSRNLPER